MELKALTEELGRLRARGAGALATREHIKALCAALAQLDALVTEAVGIFDASKEWQEDRARSAMQWLTGFAHQPSCIAGPLVARARKLEDLPECRAAWAAGEITAAHLDVIAHLRRPATQAAMAAGGEALLVREAKDATFDQFRRYAQYWAAGVSPTDADDRAKDQREQREVALRDSWSGMWKGRMNLDPVTGAVVSEELERLTKPLYDADWEAAKARLGRNPLPHELDRTAAQRAADALRLMAERSKRLDGPTSGTPLFTVLVDFPTFGTICQLATGAAVAPGAVAPFLDGALIERAVWKAPDRVDISEYSRFFVGSTRRAVEVAHPDGCFEEFCDAPIAQCEIDHEVAVADGGLTVQANGRPGCHAHNLLKENLRKHDRWVERHGDPPGTSTSEYPDDQF
jgi:hypothetical protein